jgi:thiopurine S-methyltransferase
MKQTIDWHSYWRENRTGFHEGQVNPYLERFLPLFNLQPGDAVFMPLCGKAVDMHWLAQQDLRVVGVEISDIAIESFAEESGVAFDCEEDENFKIFKSSHITLYQGDYMNMRAKYLADIRLVYDRAALIAIERFNRESYAEHMLRIIPTRTPMLVVTLDYDQNRMQGPPFAVSPDEIQQLYATTYRSELLSSSEQLEERPKWRELGLTSLVESALKLTAA